MTLLTVTIAFYHKHLNVYVEVSYLFSLPVCSSIYVICLKSVNHDVHEKGVSSLLLSRLVSRDRRSSYCCFTS